MADIGLRFGTGPAGQLVAVGRTVTELLLERGLPVRPMVRREDEQTAPLTAMLTRPASEGYEKERKMTEHTRSTRSATKKAAPRADKADGESAVLATIAAMPDPDRALAERLHAIVKASAPTLAPRLWYGMPAYARDGKVVCFFQSAQKFKTRYATFGFMHEANLDEGGMWPTAFALKELTAAEEARIGALVKKAVS